MKTKFFVFGKLKTPGLRDTGDYYIKLLRSWTEVEEIELRPQTVPDKSPITRLKIQEKEGELLLEQIEKRADPRHFYLLDEKGKPRTTYQWAEWLQDEEKKGGNGLTLSFCIGSSLGFSEPVRKKAKGLFSLGPQTLSHELARVVLLEQVYRAQSVTKGHPYHNEGS
ncbi:MAG: 23S rRNA (pseudouridine(1915)-N(3))-methyltransferase RlmH [Bdellovibrio sp.]|nr:23S rRNA (pseudouridine(1915)-N(3))-methyltransferase RlmH [Bdellovibrio sp.]